jgi:hypothetical protein
MTLEQFEKWKTTLENDESDARKNRHRLTKRQKANREQVLRYNQFQKERYEREIIIATNDRVLSMDGVVKGLRYSMMDKKFVAQYHYLQKVGMIKEGIMTVTDDWVFDTYGKEIAQMIIDRGQHREFITPLDAKGQLVMVPFEDQKITRVKYVPEK